MNIRKTAIAALAFTATAMLAASPASAAPVNAKNSLEIDAVCGSKAVTVVVNGNGAFTPADVVGSNQVFVPYAFNLTFSAGPFVDLDTAAKKAETKNLVTCTIHDTIEGVDNGEPFTATLDGTVQGKFEGRK